MASTKINANAISATQGAATAAGDAITLTGGAGGATSGAGGAAGVRGGAATNGNSAGGAVDLTGGAGQGTGAGGAATVVGGASGTGATGNGGAASVTGGAAASTNGNGGSVVLTPGAKAGTGVAGVIRQVGVVTRKQAAPTAMTTAATITVAGMLGGIITATHSAGATAAYTLPTGTVMDAALPGDFAAEEAFDLTIINLSSAAADTVTLTAASGFTIVGDPIVQSAHASSTRLNSGTFRCRKTAANTFVAYRIS